MKMEIWEISALNIVAPSLALTAAGLGVFIGLDRLDRKLEEKLDDNRQMLEKKLDDNLQMLEKKLDDNLQMLEKKLDDNLQMLEKRLDATDKDVQSQGLRLNILLSGAAAAFVLLTSFNTLFETNKNFAALKEYIDTIEKLRMRLPPN